MIQIPRKRFEKYDISCKMSKGTKKGEGEGNDRQYGFKECTGDDKENC